MKKILTNLLVPLLILLPNLFLVKQLFQGGYTREIGSIESVFIADARFVFDNFPNLSWNPYWYTGFPFHLFYTPLLPFLMAGLHALWPGVDLSSWYRVLIGIFYATTSVSLYFLVKYLTRKSLVGFMAAFAYSFFPSLAYLLAPRGIASLYGYAPWQLLTLIVYGEGGHIVGLFFLPLALLFSTKAIRKASSKNVFLAGFFISLLALANIIALIGFAVMFLVILVIEFFKGEWSRKFKHALVTALFGFGLAAFWYNLSFIKASLSIGTGGAAGGVGDVYIRYLPIFFLLLPVFFILAFVAKKKALGPILVGGGWILIFFASAFFWFRNETMLLPQPNRYLPEMGMGAALLFSWIVFLFVERIFARKQTLGRIFYLLLVLATLFVPLGYFGPIQKLLRPHEDITQTSEHRVASWLKDNTAGDRVYASGSTAFWLNTFYDIPQVRGGNDGVANPWILHAFYQINTGENAPEGKEGEIASWWLRILNVSYLVVNFSNSREIFHDFRLIDRFDEAEDLTKVVNLNGDVIYKVLLTRPSLAQAVNKKAFAALTKPKNAVDEKAVFNYLEYIDGSGTGEAQFSWLGIGRAKINVQLDQNEGVGLQITYNPGWKAFVGGQEVLIKKDPLGFMFFDPKKEGKIEVDLVYKKTPDVWLGYGITFLTVLTFIIFCFYPKLNEKLFSR